MTVAIAGGGFAGAALAFHLRRAGVAVTIVERGPHVGRGVAYGVTDDVFRLNVPAGRMSLDPADPDDFAQWAGAARDAFLPRTRYGAYVEERLGAVDVVRGDAVAVRDGLVLADGTHVAAETVVLATGHAPRVVSTLPADPRIVDAWNEPALATLPLDGDVVIAGAGLSALDVVAWLARRGFAHAVTIVSRRGLLPRPFVASASELTAPRTSLRALVRWVRAAPELAAAIEAVRRDARAIWRGWSPSERAAFVRHVRRYWDVVRHRAPADMRALVDAWRARGQLRVIAGHVRCRAEAEALVVELPAGELRARAVVRCLGPALAGAETSSPLVQDLLATGRATLDPAGLGIVTDEAGQIAAGIYGIGTVCRASSWETTSVPEIVRDAVALAQRLSR